jgi:hypothetical protein
MIDSKARIPKPISSRALVVDKVGIWLSKSRYIDGLWVGSWESAPWPGLHRVEDALHLLKQFAPLHYSRVIRHLERIWVNLLPDGVACYRDTLKACMLDERFVLDEATTLARIAAAIVHEATHARLERWKIRYDEVLRSRIEAICLRRELNFAAGLPNSAPLQEELARTLEWCVSDPDYFSDVKFRERGGSGEIEALNHVGVPDWLIQILLKLRPIIYAVRKLVRRRN